MRIAVITSSYPRYLGDPTAPFIKSICEHMVKLGHDIAVVAPYDPAVEHQADKIVPVHRFRYIWPEKYHVVGHAHSLEGDLRLRSSAFILLPFFLISSFFALLRITGKQKSQAIHAHWVLPNGLVAALVSRLRNIPLIISLHGSDIFVAKSNPRFVAISKWIFKQTHAVTACSPELKQDAILLGAFNISLLPWGADPDIFSPEFRERNAPINNTGKIIIAGVGRLVSKKGFNYLIRAFSQVLQEYPDVQLILGGDGPEKKQLILQSESLRISSKVRFIGKIPWDEMPKFLANIDIFVLPSVHDERGNVDGLPTILLEAMSSGIAAIASDIGGTSLVISNGVNGILVPPGDNEALKQALLNLIKYQDLRIKLANSARKSIIDKFNWAGVARSLIELISQTSEG